MAMMFSAQCFRTILEALSGCTHTNWTMTHAHLPFLLGIFPAASADAPRPRQGGGTLPPLLRHHSTQLCLLLPLPLLRLFIPEHPSSIATSVRGRRRRRASCIFALPRRFTASTIMVASIAVELSRGGVNSTDTSAAVNIADTAIATSIFC